MITYKWLRERAWPIKEDDTIMFFRHPRHFMFWIEYLGWTRLAPEDMEVLVTELETRYHNKRIREEFESCRGNYHRIVEHAFSMEKLLTNKTAQDTFKRCFPEDNVVDTINLIKDEFLKPDEHAISIPMPGGNSWFIYDVWQETYDELKTKGLI